MCFYMNMLNKHLLLKKRHKVNPALLKQNLDVQTQRRYRTKYGKNSPPRSSIRQWHKKFTETGSVLDAARSGQLRISAENIGHIKQELICSPIKSIRTDAREMELPPTTEHKILHKRLRLDSNKLQNNIFNISSCTFAESERFFQYHMF